MSNNSPTQAAAEPRMVPLARINVAEGHNPRSDFDAGELVELTASVRQYGVITPVLVCPDENAKGDYQLVAGERRCAPHARPLTEIPAFVRHFANDETLDLAITENLHTWTAPSRRPPPAPLALATAAAMSLATGS